MLKRILLSATIFLILSLGNLALPLSIASAQTLATPAPGDGDWTPDNDVTFAGKNAKRSGDLLDWVIANHQWANNYTGDPNNNPFTKVWFGVRNSVYALLTLSIIIAAFVIIVTRGQNIGVRKFVVRLVIVVALITLSFSIIQFLYQIIDIIQGFFLRKANGQFISSRDLLSVSFNYKDFMGYRKFGAEFDESAFVSLLLVKLTAASYYAVFMILMIRKIILWFFIVVSPIFPILLLFSPLRNTAKIWAGEFFRWALYGPLFAVLLAGLVTFWTNWKDNVPLNLTEGAVVNTNSISDTNFKGLPCSDPSKVSATDADLLYPTAINILLGGPCQLVTKSNNINIPSSFIQYLVALLMIWLVIILPFILLRIFLTYLNNFSYSESNLAKYVTALRNSPILERYNFGGRSTGPRGPPGQPSLSSGQAMALPTLEKAQTVPLSISENASVPASVSESQQSGIDEELARSIKANLERATSSSQSQSRQTINSAQTEAVFNAASSAASSATSSILENSEILRMVNLSIPKMEDIAKFDSALLSKDSESRAEASKVYEALNRVAGTSPLTTPVEREQMIKVSEKIIQESSSGNPVASAILSASSLAGQVGGVRAGGLPRVILKNYQALSKVSSVVAIPNLNFDLKFSRLQEGLEQESKVGNIVAKALLSNVPAVSSTPTQQDQIAKMAFLNHYEAVSKITALASDPNLSEGQKITQIAQSLDKEAKAGNPLAVSVISVLNLAVESKLPDSNAVQQVNLEQYEHVRQTWIENYQKLDVPPGEGNLPRTRREWLQQEVSRIPQVIDSINSPDPVKQKQGKEMVSKILPFLLLGGFSKTEVVSYLKAKLAAAKAVLGQVQQSTNEDDLLERQTKKIEEPKAMTLEAKVEEQTKPELVKINK